MNFIRVIDFEDGTIQIFHYEVAPSASTQNQECSRMNAEMPITNLSSNHTSKDRSHENPIFKSLSNICLKLKIRIIALLELVLILFVVGLETLTSTSSGRVMLNRGKQRVKQ